MLLGMIVVCKETNIDDETEIETIYAMVTNEHVSHD